MADPIMRDVSDGYTGWVVLKGAANGDRSAAARMTAVEMLSEIWRRRWDVMQAARFAGAAVEANSVVELAAEHDAAAGKYDRALSSLIGQFAYRFIVDAAGSPLNQSVKGLKRRRAASQAQGSATHG